MQRLLIICAVVLWASLCSADGKVVGWPAAGGGGCTGDEGLAAHFENNDDLTVGTPAGCSAGADDTWTVAGATYSTVQTQDGSYSLLLDDDEESATIDINASVTSGTEGTLDFYLYFTSIGSGDLIRLNTGSVDFNIVITVVDTDEIQLAYRTDYGTVTLATTDCNMSTSAWTNVIVKWRYGATDPALSVACGGTTAEDNTDLHQFTSAVTTLIVGNGGGWSTNGYVDNLHIYDTWQ